ncbi:MAG: 30S ribosomal protein S16 [Candidatus Zambryskibacteria bacterium]|nr:30S ribosomal protein S16 [Candidatus Zambryskibacteria bacterium]
MLKIRLQRVGRKHEPAYRLVLTDSKNSTKSGKFLEILGNYDSRRGEQSAFKAERITHWMSKGAQTSDTVHNLLISKKIIEGKKKNVLPKKSPITKPASAESSSTAKEESSPTPSEGEGTPTLGESFTEVPAEPVAEEVV